MDKEQKLTVESLKAKDASNADASDKIVEVKKEISGDVGEKILVAEESGEANEPPHIDFFKSSGIPQSEEIKEFFKKQISKNPYNKYCIDCKKKHTSHALIWLGIYVCEGCANGHVNQLPNMSQSKVYVKDVYNEHWDDYQLKSLQLGGNKPLFEFMKEYDIQDLDFASRYKHKALAYYQRRHTALLDETQFLEPKPAKDFNEELENTKQKLKSASLNAKADIVQFRDRSVSQSYDFSIFIDQKAQALAGKVKEQKWAQKINMWARKVSGHSQHNRNPSMDEDGGDDRVRANSVVEPVEPAQVEEVKKEASE